MGSSQKKGIKGQQEISIGAMYTGACDHIAFKAGGNERAQLAVVEHGGDHVGEVHDCPQQPCGLEIRRLERAKLTTEVGGC